MKTTVENTIIVFTKVPELGKVKTRLAQTTGNETAVAVYKKLLRHTHKVVTQSNDHLNVFYGGHIPSPDPWFPNANQRFLQPEGDLGDRMWHGVKTSSENGATKVILLGCDCPSLSPQHIQTAFEKLNSHDIVIGPADDGGYYLLGMNVPTPYLFEDMPWSTEKLLEITLEKIKENNHTYFLLETLSDLDYWEDLPETWKKEFSK